MMGGFQPGDLASIVGRPQEGKTWAMTWLAHHAWWVEKRPTLLVTVEMTALAIEQRLAALHAGIPHGPLRLGHLTSRHKTRLQGAMLEAKGRPPLWVVDGSQAPTADEIILLAQQLAPDAVYIDGAYLLKHPDKNLQKFRRVAAVCDQLKFDLAMGQDLACVASWQFSRGAVKRKPNEGPPGLEDISYADEIGQNSSLVAALLGEKNPETVGSKLMDILKGRNGEVGQLRIKWDFEGMDFSQLPREDDGTVGGLA